MEEWQRGLLRLFGEQVGVTAPQIRILPPPPKQFGEVAEWLKALVSKTGRAQQPSWVRIPPSPLMFKLCG